MLKDWLYDIPSFRHWLQGLPALPYPLKALVILSVGIILLRIAGKRSLAEMTVAEAVMRISIGTILIQPLGLKNEWEAIYGGTLLIIGIVLLTKMMIWIPKFRSLVVGVPSVIIRDGKMRLKEIRRAKLTTDEIEVALRQNKVGNVKDVEVGILESSGKLSTTLRPNKSPATKEDIQRILDVLAENGIRSSSQNQSKPQTAPLFKEAFHEAKKDDYRPQEI